MYDAGEPTIDIDLRTRQTAFAGSEFSLADRPLIAVLVNGEGIRSPSIGTHRSNDDLNGPRGGRGEIDVTPMGIEGMHLLRRREPGALPFVPQ